MCKLNYDELVLINNLIYLEWDAYEDEGIYEVAENILKDDNLQELMDKMTNCIIGMKKEEWIKILNLILNNSNFKDIRIKNVENHKSGIRSACFIDNENNVTVVFRGTTTIKEWKDNGQGAYEYDTKQQVYALNYINSLNYENITVTGHSKGGNKAQYVTVLSPKVLKCVSINGQGFSNEFIKKYNKYIKKNSSKIIALNSKYDYVNCLFNPIAGKEHYIKTDFQINPLFYHKTNIMLDENGNLREETNRSIFSKIINDFSTSLISDLPKDIKSLTIDGLISGIEGVLCKEETGDKIIKILGSLFVLLTYGRYFKVKETLAISYTIVELLLIPLLLWGNFINVEETNSKELLNNILSKTEISSSILIEKLNFIETKKSKNSHKISKAINNFIEKLKIEKEKL